MWRTVWLSLFLFALGEGEDLPTSTVVTSQGKLKGTILQSRGGREFSAFQGIPYAAPPVGPLRFQNPIPVEPWEGDRDATQPGSVCIQANFTSRASIFGSEDCLYLNVYSHKVTTESKTPVLVFIHGGGFENGAGSEYKPDFMMDKDIVLVTFNYRLGALGFLSMGQKELSGNYGLKDQTAALKWVRDNIAQFGGDPGSVTICGESAGGASVHYHMLSPLSKGLFHRGISQSGTAYCPWAANTQDEIQTTSERFAASLGCNHHSIHDTLDCLRDMPAYVIVEIQHSLYQWHLDPIIVFPPTVEPSDVEDAFFTTDPWKLSSDIPWISGITSAEGVFRVKMFEEKHIIELNDEFETIGPLTLMFRATAEDPVHTAFAIKKFYFFDSDIKPTNFEELVKMYSDSWFAYPVIESFRKHRGQKYFYYFDYRGANSLVPDYSGVSHFDDMQYFYPMDQFFKNINTSVEDTKMSEKVIDLWTNFVIHGKPTLESSDVSWDEASSGNDYLHLTNDGFLMKKDLLKDRDSFWSKLPYREKYIEIKKDEL